MEDGLSHKDSQETVAYSQPCSRSLLTAAWMVVTPAAGEAG